MPPGFLLYVAVALSAVAAAVLVYRYDLYNREPRYMLALAAGVGAGAMRLAAEIELWSLRYVEISLGQAAIAALHEELARLAAVLAIALLVPRHFDDPMDGIVYGSIVGLGMAVEESFSVLPHRAGGGPEVVFVEVVRLLGHLVMGGIGGFGVGLGRTGISGWQRGLAICFSFAVGLHLAWDWVALASPEGPSGFHSVLAGGILLSGMLFYGMLVVVGSRLSKALFDPASSRSLWGFPFRSPKARETFLREFPPSDPDGGPDPGSTP